MLWVYHIWLLLCCCMFLLCLPSREIFIINGCWTLSKAFSASIEIIIWLLSFNLLMWWITLIDLWILKNPCIPGIKPTWSWCIIFLMCCWILIARILLRIFASVFIRNWRNQLAWLQALLQSHSHQDRIVFYFIIFCLFVCFLIFIFFIFF